MGVATGGPCGCQSVRCRGTIRRDISEGRQAEAAQIKTRQREGQSRGRTDVDATPATCAVVLADGRMLLPQPIQQVVHALDVKELRHAAAVRRITAHPVGVRGRAVAILTVDVDAVFGDDGGDRALHPLLCCRDTVVEEALLRRVEAAQEAALLADGVHLVVALHHALRLEPQQEPQPGGMCRVRERAQPAREPGRVGAVVSVAVEPVPTAGPNRSAGVGILHVPAGVEPERVDAGARDIDSLQVGDVGEHRRGVLCHRTQRDRDDRGRGWGRREGGRGWALVAVEMLRHETPPAVDRPPARRMLPARGVSVQQSHRWPAHRLARAQPRVKPPPRSAARVDAGRHARHEAHRAAAAAWC